MTASTTPTLPTPVAQRARFHWPAWGWSLIGVIAVWACIVAVRPAQPFDPLAQALSLAPFLVLVALGQMLVITLGWILRAPTTISWSLILTAIALVLLHLSSSFAAQLPSYARVRRSALRRWWLPAATATVLTGAIAGAAALVRHANVPGSLAVTSAAIGLTAVTIWLTAGQKLNRD